MDSSTAIEGREFDWFARDQAGALAVFATAGSGPVPPSVLRCTAAHDAVGDAIPVSGWGSTQVWQSYAAAGLYAYDWDGTDHLYRKVAAPVDALLPEIAAFVAEMSLPICAARFSKSLEVRLGDLQHGT